jgi:hypothetical protein
MSRQVALLFVCSVFAASCQQSSHDDLAGSPQPTLGELVARQSRGPVLVSIRGPEQPAPGEIIEVEVTLQRRGRFDAPVEAALRLPQGVTLVSGDKSAMVPSRTAQTLFVYRVLVDAMPTEDLVVTLHARTAAAGFHAELRYGFGRRTATATPVLDRGATAVRIGEHSFGPAVEVPWRH